MPARAHQLRACINRSKQQMTCVYRFRMMLAVQAQAHIYTARTSQKSTNAQQDGASAIRSTDKPFEPTHCLTLLIVCVCFTAYAPGGRVSITAPTAACTPDGVACSRPRGEAASTQVTRGVWASQWRNRQSRKTRKTDGLQG